MMLAQRQCRWKEAGRFEAPGVCRWCGQAVPKPRRFCDDPQCKIEIRVRAEPRFARRMVGRRDRGVCAKCGCDTLKLLRILRTADHDAALAVFKAIGFHGHYRRAGNRWQMDHIVAVVDGGGMCGLDNLRTLCSPCHKAETAALCQRLAAERREQQQQRKLQEQLMNIGNAFPSRYLKASNITQPVRVRIDRVETEDVSGKGKKEMKPVLYFVGKEKGMVCNKTNASVIEAAYGSETDEWRGKVIEIYAGETQYAGDMVPCLRVRIPKAPAAAAARPAPTRVPVESPVSEEPQFEEADVPF